MLSQYGSVVQVNRRRNISAINIELNEVRNHFDIVWEDHVLWAVDQGLLPSHPEAIVLQEYRNYGTGIGVPTPGVGLVLEDWDDLISRYDEKRLNF